MPACEENPKYLLEKYKENIKWVFDSINEANYKNGRGIIVEDYLACPKPNMSMVTVDGIYGVWVGDEGCDFTVMIQTGPPEPKRFIMEGVPVDPRGALVYAFSACMDKVFK